jgi:hypothetical protein
MTAPGQKQTFGDQNQMSALPRKRTSESRIVMSALANTGLRRLLQPLIDFLA